MHTKLQCNPHFLWNQLQMFAKVATIMFHLFNLHFLVKIAFCWKIFLNGLAFYPIEGIIIVPNAKSFQKHGIAKDWLWRSKKFHACTITKLFASKYDYNAIDDNPMLISSPLLTERNALRFIELFMFAVTNIDILIFD